MCTSHLSRPRFRVLGLSGFWQFGINRRGLSVFRFLFSCSRVFGFSRLPDFLTFKDTGNASSHSGGLCDGRYPRSDGRSVDVEISGYRGFPLSGKCLACGAPWECRNVKFACVRRSNPKSAHPPVLAKATRGLSSGFSLAIRTLSRVPDFRRSRYKCFGTTANAGCAETLAFPQRRSSAFERVLPESGISRYRDYTLSGNQGLGVSRKR